MEIPEAEARPKLVATMAGVIVQIILLDIVFSLDSVITAIGMAQDVKVMIAAIVIAIFVMLLGSGAISGFIHQHPFRQDFSAEFFAAHRRYPHRRGLFPPYSQRLYIFCHGIFGRGGDDQPHGRPPPGFAAPEKIC